jgi:hypothetical protein
MLKILHMESTKKFPRGILDSVISNSAARTATEACTESGPSIWFFQDHQWKQRHNPSYKQQATSVKPQAPIFRKRQATSSQASSDKRQALRHKRQASSRKRQAAQSGYPHKVSSS